MYLNPGPVDRPATAGCVAMVASLGGRDRSAALPVRPLDLTARCVSWHVTSWRGLMVFHALNCPCNQGRTEATKALLLDRFPRCPRLADRFGSLLPAAMLHITADPGMGAHPLRRD